MICLFAVLRCQDLVSTTSYRVRYFLYNSGSKLIRQYVAEFAVADIEDILWSSVPFDGLVIPKEQEEAVMALAETHARRVPGFEFDDIVAGKGRGLIVLLLYES